MADGKRIEIDLTGMREFSTQLQSLVDKDIAPTAGYVRQQLTAAGAFGIHSASPVVQGAALRYWEQMEAGISFLEGLAHNTGAIARTALDVVTSYQDADIESLAQLKSIEGSASTAQTEVEQAALATERRAAEENRLTTLNEHRELRGGGA